MTRTDKQRQRLIALLEELFQIDQPDLDFGFYKIMHAKAETVSNFMQHDLLKNCEAVFGKVDSAKEEEARLKYEQALEQAKSFNAPDPEETEPVQKAKAAYDAVKDSGANEAEVYEHLYRFFERYYDNGDFMSRRYFARETGSKAAPYSIPYDGREVHLHWANRDQYYIKTSEYLTNFTFDIAKHFKDANERVLSNVPESLKLHCRIVDAAEGEHNNNKTNDDAERFFMIHADKPIVMENGELVLQFEYRPDNEKPSRAPKWQEHRIEEAENTILHALTGIGEAKTYNEALRIEIGEDNNKRTMLRKYLNQYTKRNTTDYFIHKDLGNFFKRELDFYIKNEIMRLDDIESADAPHVEAYLGKIKVLRKIAMRLIEFLTQLEEFQKKLWLKKKFVAETQYCITLDYIPEDMYAEIASNEAQRQEWVTLFAIDELEDYSEPLTLGFLKANPFLVLDTAFFGSGFKDALIASIQNFDENLDGLLVHSENFQALGLMQEKYKEQVKCIYIDPPYNTSASEIVYKNGYKHSSWCSLMENRMVHGKSLLENKGVQITAIDDTEFVVLAQIIDSYFINFERNTVIINHHPAGAGLEGANISETHEYAIFSVPMGEKILRGLSKEGDYSEVGFMRTGTAKSNLRIGRPNSFYAVLINPKTSKIIGAEPPPQNDNYPIDDTEEGNIRIYPKSADGTERVWRRSYESFFKELENGNIICKNGNSLYLRSSNEDKSHPIFSNWTDKKYNAGVYGTNVLKNILGSNLFSYPKSIYTVMDCINSAIKGYDSPIILDYFSGSGTTGHAVVNLNRDGGKRKYIMVEMGNYFDDVTKPRMQKVVYSKDWKDGKPVGREGISHAFKYIRLESYEDALNNLSFKEDVVSDKVLKNNDDFRHDYMLKYWLEFETKDSPSLLNIDYFDDPTSYKLNLKKPSNSEYEEKAVDVVESFNWLIGLHIEHLDQWKSYDASFKREPDPELPKDDTTRLILDGGMKESKDGKWLFRKVQGRICRNPGNMDNTDRVLVIWRKLTGNLEEDNLMLDEWFKKHLSTEDSAFDIIYVNGSNNLQNLREDSEKWEVRLIEKTFHQKMWDMDE